MLDLFAKIFDGIVSTMSDIEFFGVTLWQFSIGLSILALAIALFLRLFVGYHK